MCATVDAIKNCLREAEYEGVEPHELAATQGVWGMPELLTTLQRLVRLNAPDWFDRPDFVRYLESPGTATWHHKGVDPNCYSDIFFTYENGEGSDSPTPHNKSNPGFPDDVWDILIAFIEYQLGKNVNALVWVTNLR